jgi:thiol-disulfide isomerase/thioredoxin
MKSTPLRPVSAPILFPAWLCCALLALGLTVALAPADAAPTLWGSAEGEPLTPTADDTDGNDHAEARWFTDLEEAAEEARETGKNLLVDLYADWCGWCKKMDAEVFPDPAFQQLAERFVLLRVDVEDGDVGEQLQQRHGAGSLPATLLLTPRLSRIGTIRGYAPTSVYVKRIEGELQRYTLQEQHFESLLASNDPAKILSVAQELHRRGDGLRAAEIFLRLAERPDTQRDRIPRMHYARADALRLGGDYEGALAAIQTSRRLAEKTADATLIEANDMLRMQVARDQGDCRRFKAALNLFLEDHPESSHRKTVQKTLRNIDEGRERACS